VGYRASRDIREETQRGGSKKGVQGRGRKEVCCYVQGGEGEEA
jgi:ribosome modulation factor